MAVESLTAPSASRFTASNESPDSMRGEKRLAAAVIAFGLQEKDHEFLGSEGFLFWAGFLGCDPTEAQHLALKAVAAARTAPRITVRERVLRMAAEKPHYTAARIARTLGCSASAAKDALREARRPKESREDGRGATNGAGALP
jgi:hypothetical protein